MPLRRSQIKLKKLIEAEFLVKIRKEPATELEENTSLCQNARDPPLDAAKAGILLFSISSVMSVLKFFLSSLLLVVYRNFLFHVYQVFHSLIGWRPCLRLADTLQRWL
jgi:hypothetical protein